MQRKTKNIILLCGGIVFTGYLSTKSSSSDMPNISQNGNQPPEIPNGNNQGEPPEKPDGEMSDEQGNSNSNMEEPPEKPEEDNTNPPDMPNNGGMDQIPEQLENTSNNYVYLIIFGLESLTLSIIVLYFRIDYYNKRTYLYRKFSCK